MLGTGLPLVALSAFNYDARMYKLVLLSYAGVIITAVDSFLLLLIDRLGVRNLEAMFGVLVGVMAVAFGYMFADVGVDYGQVLEGILLETCIRCCFGS